MADQKFSVTCQSKRKIDRLNATDLILVAFTLTK